MIMNIIYWMRVKKRALKTAESVKTEEINEVITSLPRGRLNFYESTEGHKLSLTEYEAVCKNTKIVTQRSSNGSKHCKHQCNAIVF